jgi:hypothetical protein
VRVGREWAEGMFPRCPWKREGKMGDGRCINGRRNGTEWERKEIVGEDETGGRRERGRVV